MSALICLPLPTERLLLRDFVPSDLKALFACMSDPAVTRFMYYGPMTLAQTEEHLLQLIDAQGRSPRTSWELAVVRASDQAVLGACDIMLDAQGHGDLGYLLARGAWGQGYASEAAGAMVRQGFMALELPRIYSLCHCAHRASARVMEKAGLLREALLRDHPTPRNESWDMLLYSRTRDSWLASLAAGGAQG
jgi:RimJ/RimL family protein N-acetyltransferase